METNELKPCPFCGAEDCETYTVEETAFEIDRESRDLEVVRFFLWGVGCYNCSAKIYGFDTEEEAIEAWNTRAERTCRNVAEKGVLFECNECGAKTVDAVGNYTQEYCAACGAKVIGAKVVQE